jgi:hypothetical protein
MANRPQDYYAASWAEVAAANEGSIMKRNEHAYFEASWEEVADECGFTDANKARQFAQKTMKKLLRRLRGRGVYSGVLPETRNIWDDLENG